MFDKLLSIVAPHPCSWCGKLGFILCDNCKYNISSERFDGCVSCGGPSGQSGLCGTCTLPYSRAWCVGERSGELRKLIDDFKFEGARAAHIPLAELMSEGIGRLPETTVIVPIPTIAPHIRQRGYDHALLLARALAVRQGVGVAPILSRRMTSNQRGASKSQREQQARDAFVVRGKVWPDQTYIIVDDIITTGATIKHAARVLREAGATEVWVAALARQPLD